MVEISLKKYSAAIFDMDGTMINNMPYHQAAWTEFINRHRLNIDESEFRKRTSGMKNSLIFEFIFERKLSKQEITDYTEEKEAIYRELYRPHLKEIEGLGTALNRLGKVYPLAIATTAPEKNRTMCLAALELEEVFDVVLGDEHVTHGKPNPEIYLETAKALKVIPSECMVFEDTPAGVQSAKDAGMYVIGILSTHSAEELHLADVHVKTYTELTFID